jgi:predicted dithiol-disulfide oxidoreductase (DUF899 family)
MVEVDGSAALEGKAGPTTLLDAFEGRRMLVAYFHMWYDGAPAPGQCEGCTFFSSQVRELSYLHSRDVTWAVFSQGPYPESARYREFMGQDAPWYSVVDRETLVADRWFGMQVCYLRVGDRVYETYWSSGRAAEVFAPSYGLLDLTVYGRQEAWEDSPDGWPRLFTADSSGGAFRLGGRPIGQWPRLEQGYDDTLS